MARQQHTQARCACVQPYLMFLIILPPEKDTVLGGGGNGVYKITVIVRFVCQSTRPNLAVPPNHFLCH